MYFHPWKVPAVYKLLDTDRETGLNLGTWCLHATYPGETYSALLLLCAEAMSRLIGRNVNFRNNRFPRLIHQVSIHDIEYGVDML
jgi:hypothetical protein